MKFIKAWKVFLYGIHLLLILCLLACDNNPYPRYLAATNTYFSDFSESPKTLDPAQAYEATENLFIAQIYEPPLQYHYLRRPYQLIPLTVSVMPTKVYLDKQGKVLGRNTVDKDIVFTRYIITIKKNIFFEPHPAFLKNKDGTLYYQKISKNFMKKIFCIADFPKMATRELIVDDYIYQIKRLAFSQNDSPIAGFMKNILVGWDAFQAQINSLQKTNQNNYLDLRTINFSGLKKINDYQYSITIHGKYPQFIYWLAMPFFAPVPWEADYFYSNPLLKEKNITLSWYPIGTGPYRLVENNPNRKMVLEKNPNFHGERFPQDEKLNNDRIELKKYFGKSLPFIKKIIFSLEKESIPKWSKFLQGYYDESSIDPSSFNQTVSLTGKGNLILTPLMQAKNIQLRSSITPSIFYFGFNMLDPIVGGYTSRAQKLRQAISIAINIEQYINIFLNGRAMIAASPIPPGIFGYKNSFDDFNPYVYKKIFYNKNRSVLLRRNLDEAKKLLDEAGYHNGIDQRTGKPLLLNYDVATGGISDQNYLSWMRKQFYKIGLNLNIRATDNNRFQEKIRTGNVQIFFSGWIADYPDPENFLFLFYGKNSKVINGGENYSNYYNQSYDQFFEKMKNMPNNNQRNIIIEAMIKILRQDSPIIFGFYMKNYTLAQPWIGFFKSNGIARNILKYKIVNAKLRVMKQKEWNHANFFPIFYLIGFLILIIIPVIIQFIWNQYKHPTYPIIKKNF